jgi:hypothetical protein
MIMRPGFPTGRSILNRTRTEGSNPSKEAEEGKEEREQEEKEEGGGGEKRKKVKRRRRRGS